MALQRSYDALAEAKGELDSRCSFGPRNTRLESVTRLRCRLAMEMVTREHLQVDNAAVCSAALAAIQLQFCWFIELDPRVQDALRRKQHELADA
jgi:hypothetical protein